MPPGWNRPGECPQPGCPNYPTSSPAPPGVLRVSINGGWHHQVNLVHNGDDLCFHGTHREFAELENRQPESTDGRSGLPQQHQDYWDEGAGSRHERNGRQPFDYQHYDRVARQGRRLRRRAGWTDDEDEAEEEARQAREEAEADADEARHDAEEEAREAEEAAREAREEAAEHQWRARQGRSQHSRHFQVSGHNTTVHISSGHRNASSTIRISSGHGQTSIRVPPNQGINVTSRPRQPTACPDSPSPYSPPRAPSPHGLRQRFRKWRADRRGANELAKVVVERKRNPY